MGKVLWHMLRWYMKTTCEQYGLDMRCECFLERQKNFACLGQGRRDSQRSGLFFFQDWSHIGDNLLQL